MRKIKSTALLGAFVAVASVGVISHEAHGAIILTQNGFQPAIISKEILPNSSISLQAYVEPFISIPPAGGSDTVTLTISGASFPNATTTGSYTIVNASCSNAAGSSTSSLTFESCTLTANQTYEIANSVASGSQVQYFSVSVSNSSSSIVLSYSSNLGDISTPTPIAEVQQQLTVTPASAITYYINPSNQFVFTSNSSNSASNSVVLSNNAYNNNTWSSNTISTISMTFVFTGIPGSVSTVTASDSNYNSWSLYNSGSIVNGSVTVYSSNSLNTSKPPFQTASSDTITFTFSNSSNAPISTGNISLSSIVGDINGSSTSYVYLSTPQNFLTFSNPSTQIYIPDALVPDSNEVQYSYLTISMPQGAYISSISVLNTGISCSVSSLSLANTGTNGVTYIDLSQLPSLCGPDITPKAWGSGVPLVITISGSNGSNVAPNTVTADAYAVFNGMLKRIPVNVVSGNNASQFSY